MKLEEAERFASRVVEVVLPLCERVRVAGSIRRQRPEPRDLDIVMIAKPLMFPGAIINALKKRFNSVEVIRQGPEISSVKVEGVNVDFYNATKRTWGVLLLVRTGSIEHNIKMCKRALSMGMMLSSAQGVLRNGKVIASETEQEIFEALGMEFIPPEEREVAP